ncbi:MAG: ribosomal protein S18-alanine N-acetyltransferase [Sphingomonadaceae bacterium]
MRVEDIPAVMAVERESFTMPWPSHAYRRELKENRLARYVVARRAFPVAGSDGTVQSEVASAEQTGRGAAGLKGLLDRLIDALGGSGEASEELDEPARRVVGYAGLWLMVDESHVTSIAVAPAYRGLGVGELLFLALIDLSLEIGAQYVTLEVRVSNTLAQNLYRKYGFKEAGVRRRYYSDNNEDALIMWSDPLGSPGFQQMVREHRAALIERMRSPKMEAKLRARGILA